MTMISEGSVFDFPSIILFCVIIVLAIWTFLTRVEHNTLPPGPRGLPFIGNILDFKGRDRRHVFRRLHREYGDVFSIRMVDRLVIVCSGYNTIKDVFLTHGDKTSDRNPHPLIKCAVGDKHLGVVFAKGETWKRNRRFCLRHLRNFGMGKDIIQTKIHAEAEYLMEAIDEKNGSPFDAKNLFKTTTANVIAALVMSRRFGHGNQQLEEYFKRVDENVTCQARHPMFCRPFLRFFPGDPFKMSRAIDNIRKNVSFFKTIASERQKKFKPGVVDDIIDAYLEEWNIANDEGTNGVHYSYDELTSIISELFGAGTETTATAMLWFLIHMMRHSDIQTQIQAEIDEHIPRNRRPNMDDKKNLVNLEAAIMETMRITAIAPQAGARTLPCDMQYKEYLLPKGATLLPNLDSIMVDEKLFTHPHIFRPSRFIGKDGKIIRMAEHIPFSIGRRVCPGENLARAEIFLFLSALLQSYIILPPEGSPPPPDVGTVGLTYSPIPYSMRMVRRKREDE